MTRSELVLCGACGVLMIGGVALAGLLAAVGMYLESAKVALFGFLAPGAVFMTGWLVSILRQPGWFRSAYLISRSLFAVGCALFTLSFVIWLPWMPAKSRVEDMPLVLGPLLVAGLVLASLGMLLGTLVDRRQARRGPSSN